MVLLVFLESEKKKKEKEKLPEWEICLTGNDAYMSVEGIIWGAR